MKPRQASLIAVAVIGLFTRIAQAEDDEAIQADRPRRSEVKAAENTTPSYWPAPLGWHETPRKHGRQGEGGIVVSGLIGSGTAGGEVLGARILVASRIGPSTRFGGALSLTSETGRGSGVNGRTFESSGWQATAGVVFGWGAPWNDVAAGFVFSTGVAFGDQTGTAQTYGKISGGDFAGGIVEVGPERAMSISYVAPYASASFVAQIPWRWRLRPVFGFTQSVVACGCWGIDGMTLTADVGVVWQSF